MKLPATAGAQLAAWLGLFVLELVLTRRFHPTLPIAALATAILLGGSAAAAYANLLSLWPRARETQRYLRYAGELLAVLGVLTWVVVGAIQGVYALLWHPDPLRFGLGFNLLSDAAFLSIHVALVALLARLMR